MNPDTVALAETQHGLVAVWQLQALGWTRSATRWALAEGTLVTFCPRVLAVGHRPPTPEARLLGAVLSAGPGALLSHQSAAGLWRLMRWKGPVHVTSTTAWRSRPDVRRHRSPVSGADRTTRDGIPVTALPRTILDLADVLPPADLALAVERVRHLDVRSMRRCLTRHPGRHGIKPLSRLLDAYDPDTNSPLEDAFLRLCRRYGITEPLVNAQIAGAERDFSWPDVQLVIEVDGDAFHAPRAKRNNDSRRDVDLGIAGWRPHRLTYERVLLDPAGTAEAVLALRASYP